MLCSLKYKSIAIISDSFPFVRFLSNFQPRIQIVCIQELFFLSFGRWRRTIYANLLFRNSKLISASFFFCVCGSGHFNRFLHCEWNDVKRTLCTLIWINFHIYFDLFHLQWKNASKIVSELPRFHDSTNFIAMIHINLKQNIIKFGRDFWQKFYSFFPNDFDAKLFFRWSCNLIIFRWHIKPQQQRYHLYLNELDEMLCCQQIYEEITQTITKYDGTNRICVSSRYNIIRRFFEAILIHYAALWLHKLYAQCYYSHPKTTKHKSVNKLKWLLLSQELLMSLLES